MPAYKVGQKFKQIQWDRLIGSIPSDYTIFKKGSTYYGECNIPGGTDYEDSNADDLFLYVADALPSGGKATVKRADYLKSQTLNITKSYQTWNFEAGTKITYSGSGDAIKLGCDDNWTVRSKVSGNFSLITRATKGAQYGIHLENAHVCTVDGFHLENFSDAFIYSEGSWGSTIRRVEMNQVAENRADYGILFRYTQDGAYQYHQNNLMKVRESWLTGNTAAVWVRDDQTPGTGSPCVMDFRNCDFHDCPKGIILDSGHDVVVDTNYFENVTDYLLHIRGTDQEVGSTSFMRNVMWLNAAQTGVYVENATNVYIGWNDVFDTATSTFIDTPPDAMNRWIFIYPNRIAAGTEYGGNAESLIYHHEAYPGASNTLTLASALELNYTQTFQNAQALRWKDAGGTARNVLELAGDDIVKLTNPEPNNSGHIYIMPTDGGVTDGTRGQTYVGFGSRGNISIGCPTGLVPANILLKCNAAGDVTITQANQFYAACPINTNSVYMKGGVQVVGAQGAAITDTGGGAGADNDGTARVAIDLILARLRAHGLIAT